MVDYSKSWSRKQWTRRTEGVFKNIIDVLREGKTLPKGFIIPTDVVSEAFDLIVDPAEYTAPKGIAVTKVFSVCIHARQNWAGTVALSQSNNLCGGATVTLDDASVTVSAQTPKNCTYMRLSLPSNCPAGGYKITVTGVSGSIIRTFEVEIGVGVPPDEEEEPKPCTSDDDCKKYGDDWWCVGGECKKACGTASSNCNSDYCAEGEKCIWNAGAGKCLCEKQGMTLTCPSEIQILPGQGKMAYGYLTIASVNGFAGSGNIIVYDSHQPDQSPSSCLAAWFQYGGQIGNIIPVTLPADGSIQIYIAVSGSCDSEQTHYFGVELSVGGKTAACIVTVKVKGCDGETVKGYISYINKCGCCIDPSQGAACSGGCFQCCGLWNIKGLSSNKVCSGSYDVDHLWAPDPSNCYYPPVEECTFPSGMIKGETLRAYVCVSKVCMPNGPGPTCPGACPGGPTLIVRTSLGNEATITWDELKFCPPGPGTYKTMSGTWCE